MYDELIAEMRMHHCDAKEDDTQEVCEECAYDVIIADKSVPSGIASVCVCGLMHRAADAIEELEGKHFMMKKTAEWLAEKVPHWIPVTERLPSNSTKVLVFEFGRVEQAYTTTYTADGSLCWVVINGGSYHRISDADCPIKWWMPLPEPPKEE